jgi:aspartyl/asparaginyl beta-hydroxylase (cupin superfamily)
MGILAQLQGKPFRDQLLLAPFLPPALALNAFFDLFTGGEKRGVFFDIDKVYPGLRALDQAFPEIRAEALALLGRSEKIPEYAELDRIQTRIAGAPGAASKWRVLLLEAMGEKVSANRALCPATCRALERVPGVFQAFFSVLDPGKSVPAHEGPYRGYLRYHLGLVVPKVSPPEFELAGQRYVWKEGESIFFDDSWRHAVHNSSPEPRVLLIVDVLRPLPWLPAAVNRSVSALIRFSYGKAMAKKARLYIDPKKT